MHAWYHGTIGMGGTFPTSDSSGGVTIPDAWYVSPSLYRLEAEYGLPVSFEQSRFEVCRWVSSADRTERAAHAPSMTARSTFRSPTSLCPTLTISPMMSGCPDDVFVVTTLRASTSAGVGVAVGGIGVLVGGRAVAVGGRLIAVAVAGRLVAVAAVVAVGGATVAVGTTLAMAPPVVLTPVLPQAAATKRMKNKTTP